MPEYGTPIDTVDVVLLTLRGGRLCVLLMRRPITSEVFPGALALPGGYVHVDEDEDDLCVARRVLRDKAGFSAPYLEQLYTFSGRVRDPRGWSRSVAHFAVVPETSMSDVLDSKDLLLLPVDSLPALSFDHSAIIAKAVSRLRGKSSYSTLPMYLLPETFTMSELQTVYASVLGVDLDKVTFRRRIEAQGVVEAVPGVMKSGSHRPAQIFRRSGDALREFSQTL